MLLPRFECRQAGSLLQAATLLAENPEAQALAGGTDLLRGPPGAAADAAPPRRPGHQLLPGPRRPGRGEGRRDRARAWYAFLQAHPRASRREIREAIGGNLCRCTGYHKIVDAAEAAARKLVSR